MKLSRKVAIVTGAGRGIGEAISLAFGREGAHLMLAARTETEICAVAERVRSAGGDASSISMDVTKPDEVRRLVETTVTRYGPPAILVNCAGIYGPIGPFWQVDPDEWFRAVQINLYGTFLCCQAVVPFMVNQGGGKIVNLSGGGATAPLARFSAYGSSKSAVVRLTETIAEEVKDLNIQVNAIAPGAVDTRLQDQVLAAGENAGEIYQRIKQLREEGKGGVPPELAANLAVFLASDDSGRLTGRLIAAPHDGWQDWDSTRIDELMSLPWLTLRRLDPHTLRAFGVDQSAPPRG